MATQKGTHITKFDSTPSVAVDSRAHGGLLKVAVDAPELTDTANGDIMHLVKVPVDSLIHSVKFGCDDLGTAGTVSIGFYKQNADGTYTVVDLDAFAVDIDVNTAAVAPTEYRYSAKGIETALQSAYTLAGLSARPDYNEIFVAVTTATGTTSDGTIYLKVEYTD